MKTGDPKQREAFAAGIEGLLADARIPKRDRNMAVHHALQGQVWLVKFYACPTLKPDQIEALALLVFDT